MVITVSHFLLEIITVIIKNRREKTQLQQGQEKIEIERNKYNVDLLSKVLSGDAFGKLIQEWIADPEKLKEFYTNVMQFSGDMQEFYDKEANKGKNK